MTTHHFQVLLQDIVVFTGPEPDARQVAYGLVLQIRDKHTYKDKARLAFVTASALAILRGGADEFTPDVSPPKHSCRKCRPRHSPWTVTLIDAVPTDVVVADSTAAPAEGEIAA